MGTDVLAVDQDANPHDLAIYASRRSDRGLTVIVINKTSSAHAVALNFSGASVAAMTMTTTRIEPSPAGSDTATSVSYNGAVNPPPRSLPAGASQSAATPTINVAAYSVAVVVLR
jgi:hypothetical protein